MWGCTVSLQKKSEKRTCRFASIEHGNKPRDLRGADSLRFCKAFWGCATTSRHHVATRPRERTLRRGFNHRLDHLMMKVRLGDWNGTPVALKVITGASGYISWADSSRSGETISSGAAVATCRGVADPDDIVSPLRDESAQLMYPEAPVMTFNATGVPFQSPNRTFIIR
eukprot:TRINITY_DN7198_c0_g1_i3.p1 TRINITY_DN7198_c0_g1~~TRINITY_DN7198_c0_g1_i3.p1  ORF type:complete len:169 (-),score=32.81 TRINITY_DN7198_c0_g1_i3:907-1413(-)